MDHSIMVCLLSINEEYLFLFFSVFIAPCRALKKIHERGLLFAKQEVRSIEVGPSGLFFTGDGTSLLMVWKWLEEPKAKPS